MSTYQFKLKNNKSGKEILFKHGSNISESIVVNAINFAVPGQAVENNIALNLGGFTKIISLSFILEDRGTDVSTTNDNIVTLGQQWGFIMDNTVTNNIGGTSEGIVQNAGSGNSTAQVDYTVTIYYTDSTGSGSTRAYSGMIEDISIEPVEGEPRLRGRLSLNVSRNPIS